MLWFRRQKNLYNSLVRRQSSSLSSSSSPSRSSGNISLAKTVPEGNRRSRGQDQWPSTWGSSPALFRRVGQVSTSTARSRVCGSRCGQWLETRYHSCETDQFKSRKGFNALQISGSNEPPFFSIYDKKLLQTKSSAHHSSQSSDHSLVWDGLYDIGTKQHVLNWILCKAADLNRLLARRNDVCQDSNRTAQRLQMAQHHGSAQRHDSE